ncbi:hypothetical protein, partial [Paenirhodobacter populi]|uniref:hypothetical protein n=1 Tax=Paenirhodobacter populi TaxID=2306993 RepID=UPI0019D45EBC
QPDTCCRLALTGPVRHGTRRICGKRTRHGAHPHQLAGFCAAAVADFCAAVDIAEWANFHAAITAGADIITDIADAREDMMLIEKIMAVLEK